MSNAIGTPPTLYSEHQSETQQVWHRGTDNSINRITPNATLGHSARLISTAVNTLIGLVCLLCFTGCVTIKNPVNNSTVAVDAQGHVSALVVWSTTMKPGTFWATLNGTDITSQFTVDYANYQATGVLSPLPPGGGTINPVTLKAGGKVWELWALQYLDQSDNVTFTPQIIVP